MIQVVTSSPALFYISDVSTVDQIPMYLRTYVTSRYSIIRRKFFVQRLASLQFKDSRIYTVIPRFVLKAFLLIQEAI